jgi:hypothetical protein
MEGGDSAPPSDIFCAKGSVPPPFAPREQRLMRMGGCDPEAGSAPRGRIVAERPRLPGATAHVPGRGIYAPGFSSSTKSRDGILVLVKTNVRRRGHGARAGIVAAGSVIFRMCSRFIAVIFQRTTRGRRLDALIFGHPPFCQKHLRQSQKKGNAKAKRMARRLAWETVRTIYELYSPWNHRGAGPRHRQSWHP